MTHAHVLAAVVLLAAAVRLWGLQFGLPLLLVRPDEQFISDKVMNFFRKSDPNPHFFDYPTFYMYLLAGAYCLFFLWGRVAGWFHSFTQFVASWNGTWVPFFLIGRVIGALSGTVSVWVLYEAARQVFGRRLALVSAFFLSLSFLHVRDSHYATTDVPMTCLALLAILFIVRAQDTTRVRDAVLAGALAGLATATKYNAAMLGAPMLAGAAIHVWDRRDRFWAAVRETRLMWMGAAMCAGFFAGSPYVLLDYGKFLDDMRTLSWSIARGMTPPDMLGIGWSYHARVSLRYGLGVPLYLGSLLGIILLFVRRPRLALVWCSFPVAYYALTGWSYNVFVRYMVPVVPFLCLTAAFLVDESGEWISRRLAPRLHISASAVVAGMAVLLIAPSALHVVAFNRLLTLRDSRLVAADWVRANIPAGSVVYQAGALYGQVQIPGPIRYTYWKWDRDASRFRDPNDRWSADWPDWIIVHQSPLPYSHVPERVTQRLKSDYALVHVETAVDADKPGNVYDVQDAFFLPYAGFSGVARPGPNILIYRRRR